MDKLEKGRVYFLNDQQNLELPLIDLKKYDQQKDEWVEKLDKYKEYLRLKEE